MTDVRDDMQALKRVPDECEAGFAAARGLSLTGGMPRHLVIAGVGASALAGDAVQALLAGQAAFPIFVNRTPILPAFIGAETLVIVLSYSGTDEEAVHALSDAVEKGAQILVITGGGHLRDMAETQNFPYVLIPGSAAPAYTLGSLFFTVWGALAPRGLLPEAAAGEVVETVALLRRQRDAFEFEAPTIRNPARQLASALSDVVPVFYGSPGLAAVAAHHWKTQCNKVAEIPAFWSAFPDAAYGEVDGWSSVSPMTRSFCLLTLRDRQDPPQVVARIDAMRRQIAQSDPALPSHEVYADGPSPLARLWTALHLGDWMAAYLALPG